MLSAKQFQSKPGGTVVIVDDDPIVRSLIADRITSIGGKALEAEDGVSGLVHHFASADRPGVGRPRDAGPARPRPRPLHPRPAAGTPYPDRRHHFAGRQQGGAGIARRWRHCLSDQAAALVDVLQLHLPPPATEHQRQARQRPIPEGLRFATHSTLVSSAAALKRIAARLLLRSGNDETSTDLCQVSDQLTEAASRFIGERSGRCRNLPTTTPRCRTPQPPMEASVRTMVSPFQISVPLRLWQIRRRAFADQSGSVMTTAALMLPVVVACVGLSVDYISASTARQQLQAAADAAALAGAKELSLSEINLASIDGVAKTVARRSRQGRERRRRPRLDRSRRRSDQRQGDGAQGPRHAVRSPDGRTDRHALRSTASPACSASPTSASSDSTAAASGTIRLDNLASVVGHNCSVFSNSKSSAGLKANGNSSMSASFVCSAGGVAGKKDRLPSASRWKTARRSMTRSATGPNPKSAACIATDLVVDQSTTLSPGHLLRRP